MIKEYVITDLQKLKDNGFRYDFQEKCYTYDFPVYKYKRKSLIFCKVFAYEDDKTIRLEIVENNNNLYASYYNRKYGKNDLLGDIDIAIKREFNKLGIEQRKAGDKNSKLSYEIQRILPTKNSNR